MKIALDAKELNKRIVKKKMQMPNLDDLRDRASIAATLDSNSSFRASIFDLDYAFGHADQRNGQTLRNCNCRRQLYGPL